MSKLEIDYDALVQNALRGVVKEILERTAQDGLPGDHHFYVAFRTRAEGVELADHLRARYPDEMTIVLQHKFWGLKVYDDRFEVGLSFHQNPEHLVIPFDAIVGFVDPSVQFALQFQDHEAEAEAQGEQSDAASGDAEVTDITDQLAPAGEDAGAPSTGGADDTSPAPGDDDGGDDDEKVVTLDAFRKKT